jgi:glycosyltransferase involved in cell wall biosynthesis
VSSVVIVCPDLNIRLSAGRLETAPTGGGKVAVLSLAQAWADLGHDVTITAANVLAGEAGRLRFLSLQGFAGQFDVAIYITGSLGHFRNLELSEIRANKNLFWVNGPCQVEPPACERLDWYIAPSNFMYNRVVAEWGYPANRTSVITGGSVVERLEEFESPARDDYAFVYFSHPQKGLQPALDLLNSVYPAYPRLRLEVHGSDRLWSDAAPVTAPPTSSDWIHYRGEMAHDSIAAILPEFGALLYLTTREDGFCCSLAEALAAGLIVIASDHGPNSEYIQHGRNGFLVPCDQDNRPNLEIARDILVDYLKTPARFHHIRAAAKRSVSTWAEQARAWQEVWSRD